MDLTHKLKFLMRVPENFKARLMIVYVRKWSMVDLTYRLKLLVPETRRP